MKTEDKIPPIINPQGTDEEMLNDLQRETFEFFLKEVNDVTGLVADKTTPYSAASIGVTGMTLSVYIIGVERKFIERNDAAKRILKVLLFMYDAPQNTDEDASGYKGFYYHFLEMKTGKRALESELSTIDTTFFIAGALSAAMYFTEDNDDENEIRNLAEKIYNRVDWHWALNGGETISHGWMPDTGFLEVRWDKDYSEAIIMYVLALGSPSHPIKMESYKKWTDTFKVKKVYDIEYLYAGPLFIHQFSHLWIDFRAITDAFNKKIGFDYFENSRRATYVHREYAIENPKKFKSYSKFCWGLTASNGPGDNVLDIDGKKITFYGYVARGAPFGPDDGTVSPWAVVASLPFAPEIVTQTIRHAIERLDLKKQSMYGFDASFNPTYPEKGTNQNGWVSPYRFGLNQAPIIMMIENYHSEFLWTLMKKNPHIINGLREAGFSGAWLEEDKTDYKYRDMIT